MSLDNTDSEETTNSCVKSEPPASTEDYINFEDSGSQLVYLDFEPVESEDSSVGLRQEYYDEQCPNNVRERKRTRNFTPSECALMCNLLTDYNEILDNKSVDCKSNTLKAKAWKEITQKFNSSTDYEYRTVLQLRTFYENLKKRRRKALNEGASKVSNDISLKKICDIPEYRTIMSDNSMKSKRWDVEYEKKKLELIELEIDKVKKEREQQYKLFLLQEEKLMLEIDEIKKRIKPAN